jgi:diphthine-ammonia ligase
MRCRSDSAKERHMIDQTAPKTCAVAFSGGKDSTLALDRLQRAGYAIQSLVTLYDGATERVRFHGTPLAVMQAQAAALGLPLRAYPTEPATFEAIFGAALDDLRAAAIPALAFGDIHLADVRAWYEERVTRAGLAHLEPLWGEDPARLADEVIQRGYRAIITCIEEARADPAWLGQELTPALLAAFAARGIDLCGERGEYHTLVVAGPAFRASLAVRMGTIHQENGFRQIDIHLA